MQTQTTTTTKKHTNIVVLERKNIFKLLEMKRKKNETNENSLFSIIHLFFKYREENE